MSKNEKDLFALKILTVEAEEDKQKHFSNLLHQNGFEVRSRKNLLLALESLRLDSPDLLLLDLKLTRETPKETFYFFKQELQQYEFPVVFVLDHQNSLKVFDDFDPARLDFIFRPVHDNELLFRVKKQLRLAELLQKEKSLEPKAASEISEKNSPDNEKIQAMPDAVFLRLYHSVKNLDATCIEGQIDEVAKYNPDMTEIIRFCLKEYSLSALGFILEEEKEKRQYKKVSG